MIEESTLDTVVKTFKGFEYFFKALHNYRGDTIQRSLLASHVAISSNELTTLVPLCHYGLICSKC